MIFRQLFDEASHTYTYLIADHATREAVLIDSVAEQWERDLQLIRDLGLRLIYLLETHVHADHITGSSQLRRFTDAKIMVPGGAGVIGADGYLSEGDVLTFGPHHLRVLATPGHTATCRSFLLNNTAVFTGDALLIRGTGRTDFQGGDAAALYHSITKKLYTLDDAVIVYPGHDYLGRTASTIGEERRLNARVAGRSEQEFITFMNDLKLDLPKRIHEAVPGNRLCGDLVGEGQEVTAEWVKRHKKSVVLVDVRGADEYYGELGHIPGSILAGPNDVARVVLDPNEVVITVCRSGRRSLTALDQLKADGVNAAYSMKGGMLAWNKLHQPAEVA